MMVRNDEEDPVREAILKAVLDEDDEVAVARRRGRLRGGSAPLLLVGVEQLGREVRAHAEFDLDGAVPRPKQPLQVEVLVPGEPRGALRSDDVQRAAQVAHSARSR